MGIRLFGALGLAALLVAFAVPAVVLWSSSDLPAIDDADLVPQPPGVVAPERDAFTHFERAAALLPTPSPEPEDATFAAALAGDPEALGGFEATRAANSAALAVVPDILGAPEFQIPEGFDPGHNHSEDSGPTVAGWQRVAELVAVRGLLRGEAGLEDFFIALELGQRLEGARGADFVEGVISLRVRRSALDGLATWLARHELDARMARRVASRLEEYRSAPRAWHRIAGTEYAFLKQVMLRDLTALHEGHFEGQSERDAAQILAGYFYFQPNRTVQGLAERYRVVAENGGRLCGELQSAEGADGAERPSKLSALLSRNGGGEALLAAGSPDFRVYHEQRCEMNTRIGALQVMAALSAWKAERGDLPESLGALVPGLLAEIPRDGFDGTPLQWNPEQDLHVTLPLRDTKVAGDCPVSS